MSLLNDASLVFIPSGYKEDKVYSVIPSNGAGDLDFVRGCDATRINPQALVENTPWNLLQNTNTLSQYGNTNATLTTNVTTSPIGTSDASKLMETASTSFDHYAYNVYFGSLSNTVTYSVYLKQNGRRYVQLATVSNQGVFRPIFDLQDGVYVSNAGTNTGATTSIENAGNGWFRCSVTHPSNTTSLGQITIILQNSATYQSYTGDITKGIYCWGAQLNVGTLKPYFPTTDRLNVPRLTYSPTLIERQSTNLALYSQEFDNGTWGKSECSISANQTTAPDGTLTADKLIESTNNAIHEVYSNSPISLTAGVAYTKSVYAKAAERAEVSLNFVTGGFGQGSAVIANLSNGTLGAISNYGGVSGSTATITDVSNGWYRISLTMTPVSNASFYIDYSPSLSGNRIYAGNGTSGVYVWGAQLETGSLTSYIPTTSTAVTRVASYNSGCPSLLLEKQSTNLLTYSEQFDNGAWTNVRGVVTANSYVSPNGTQNADTFASASGQPYPPALVSFPTYSGNTNYTLSIFAKVVGNTNTLQLGYVDNVVGYAGGNATYDLSNGNITINQSANGSVVASMQYIGNDWYRLVLGFLTISVPTYNYIQIGQTTNNVLNGFALWGAQLEASSYVTSYIPTTTATVTRLADSCSKTSISSLIGQTEGTLFVDINFNGTNYGNANDFFLYVGDGTNTDSIYIDYYANLFRWVVFNGTTLVFYTDLATTNGRHKLALAYKAGQYVAYADSSLILADTNATAPPTCAMVSLAQNVSGFGAINKNINQALLFKRRLTNTELANLTTL